MKIKKILGISVMLLITISGKIEGSKKGGEGCTQSTECASKFCLPNPGYVAYQSMSQNPICKDEYTTDFFGKKTLIPKNKPAICNPVPFGFCSCLTDSQCNTGEQCSNQGITSYGQQIKGCFKIPQVSPTDAFCNKNYSNASDNSLCKQKFNDLIAYHQSSGDTQYYNTPALANWAQRFYDNCSLYYDQTKDTVTRVRPTPAQLFSSSYSSAAIRNLRLMSTSGGNKQYSVAGENSTFGASVPLGSCQDAAQYWNETFRAGW